ncbi:GNAT family N-acetyltransferase [Actinoplanes oblitus]|uniref:GNAT family N-acetyltransferase n=1 Tax=Actinoplanes oblitus TaxID=3040509 RepID=A0ABY8WDW1_9ACTN|nr:GNAT family N-acetyltransferase [Actinoplanes oblitus]WIM94663.1 GNAT family N-acetyltransferase [Actinoplanes oblitus]
MDLRIQRSVVATLSNRPNAVECGPFVLGFDDSSDSPFINYATPVPGAEITADQVAALVTAFGDRKPRLEYVVSSAPTLEKLLVEAGFTVEARHEYLVCTPSTFAEPPAPAGFELFEPVSDDELTGMITVQSEAFGAIYTPNPAELGRQRRNQQRGGILVAARSADGHYAGGGAATVPSDGISEVAGIAVGERFRRRGLGGAITAAVTSRLFANGVDIAWLEASGEDSWRVYERVGFRPTGQRLYISR